MQNKKILFLLLVFTSLNAAALQNKTIQYCNEKQRIINGNFTEVSVAMGI